MLFLGGLTRWGLPRFDAPIRPDAEFFAIGDIHGCLGHLNRALQMIGDIDDGAIIVCVGDYIDRGEQSAGVLQRLYELTGQRDRFICLMGNHEDMALKFLDAPDKYGDLWLRNGGLQTLASFGVGKEANLAQTRDRLVDAMGAPLIAWLRVLPVHWNSGNIAVAHAGADPRVPIAGQTKRDLIWGHQDFEAVPRADGVWVLHGHTIVERPRTFNGTIAIDTGAYATDRLCVAHVRPGEIAFHSVA